MTAEILGYDPLEPIAARIVAAALFGIGYSWGGYSSLAVYNDPVEMGVRLFFKLQKNQHLVRLHIGLEDTNDLISDLGKALRRVK